jgi:tagatose-6-phosphate ketose/aldose isomerase
MHETHTTNRAIPAFGAEATVREIRQQPEVWREAAGILAERREAVDALVEPLLQRPNLRVVLTGAGTSAFAGGVAAPSLARLLGGRFDAVATTDIVSNPRDFFAEDVPTLLVSLARSGNSPESVAATRLADELLTDVHHLVITCDPAGRLYREHADRAGSVVVLMPSRANDEGFAMTSSFTTMLLCVLLIFLRTTGAVEALAAAADSLIRGQWDRIERLAMQDFRRVVFIGSGPLAALAHEAALKLLELTAGSVVSYHESSLGFRHGPKAVLDEHTLAVVFESSDDYTRRYDVDIAAELSAGLSEDRVLVVSPASLARGDAPTLHRLSRLDDAHLAVVYIVVAQILALSVALRAGATPDNPFPDGSVNRVVAGVEIHPLTSRSESTS